MIISDSPLKRLRMESNSKTENPTQTISSNDLHDSPSQAPTSKRVDRIDCSVACSKGEPSPKTRRRPTSSQKPQCDQISSSARIPQSFESRYETSPRRRPHLARRIPPGSRGPSRPTPATALPSHHLQLAGIPRSVCRGGTAHATPCRFLWRGDSPVQSS